MDTKNTKEEITSTTQLNTKLQNGGEGSEEKLDLIDYISVQRLQEMQNSFSALLGVGASISDENGSAITQATGMCDFCKYTRVSRIGAQRCRKCDSEGAERAFVEGKPVSYTCHAGLVDFVAPIVIDGKRVGCFTGGQVRFGELDEARIRQTAKDIGVNPDMYLALAKKTPQVSEEVLQRSMDFIGNVTLSISDMAEKQYRIEKSKEAVAYAAKLKADFLANMSHEIRTPMNGVIGLAELALREEASDVVKNYLNQIRISGKSLLAIINDILDFSKIESGKMDIRTEAYSPVTLMDEVAILIWKKAKEKGIEFTWEADPDISPVLIGDSGRIKQILLNLANNAVKFTEKGSVAIRMETRQRGEGLELYAEVTDTGIGISSDNLKKLFHSFEQVDSKRNRSVEGTGLGLAISKRLAELMGGEIGVESVVGEGSTFWFCIPQSSGTTEELYSSKQGENEAFTAPQARVLLVDDNRVNLTVARGLLKPYEVQIDQAEGGLRAIQMIAENQYDLIFMDHMMPDLDGVETTQIIRGDYPNYEDVPIVALTANVMEMAREEYIRAGMNDYLAKPIEINRLAAILHKWLPKELLIEKGDR